MSPPLSHEQQLVRQHGIGASEVGAVLGVNPYASQHNVWLSKMGLADFVESEAAELGHDLEDAIAAIYAKRTGRKVRKHGRTVEGKESWMLATPDYLVQDPERLLEIKLCGPRALHLWSTDGDGVPYWYICQCQWQMHVTGERECDLAVLMAGTELRIYSLQYDAELAQLIESRCRKFWFTYVLPSVPPPVDGSDGATEMLKKMYPQHYKEPMRAEPEDEERVSRLLQVREELEKWGTEETLLENRLKERMQQHEALVGDWWRITWKTQKDGKRPFKVKTFEKKRSAA